LAASTEIINTGDVFNNSGLFSNHYLENMIQKVPEWNDDAHLFEAYSQIKEIFEKKRKNLEKYVEADLEHNWVRPVFDKLGHHYGVQEGLHHDPLKPDYAFFPDIETLEDAYSHKKDAEGFYKKSIAVGDAKAWNVLLDKSRQGKAHREMTNPSFQIDVYLRATPPKWAILTNGRMWRLYHEDTSVKMDCYYEVNLPLLINRIEESGDITLFKYFYLFFRLAAFPQVPLGTSFLDRIREESAAYAQKIGTDLQENVYKAMKVLAEGFYAEQSNSLSHALEDIRDVQDNSMRLLYRMLFIFYAESRKLLNTDNKHYREMSLRKLKEEISGKMDQGETMLAVRSTYWEGLKDLFRLINDGSEAFGYAKEEFYIPAYNGGLFDPTKNHFLSEKKIGNLYLAEAIDLLARSPGEGKMVFVDYSSLDIRHLGSIYEGILEYKLHLAKVPMVAVKEKGKEVWLPAGEAGKSKKFSDSVEAGGLYLVTDKGERKATGSFYTPEYIVKHLVKNTLAPLIDPMMEEAIWSEELRKDLLKKLLSLKVLDPAMGSGHFLVEATDYIAREIIHAKEIARHEDLESEDVAENDIHWARREVVRNCIYGVDLNPMAVELAKLSLWLTTVASNKPLSFLDHHLRCGNSLIGAELDKLATLPSGLAEQTPLWSYGLRSHTSGLLKRYSLMAALPDDNLQMVKWKEDQFRQIKESELSRRLNELSNVWLSTFFNNKVSDDDYYELQNHLSPEKYPDWAGLREKEWFTRAQALAGEKRFFHWELEFPEAFQGENRGFDVVIGNPPYDELSEVGLGRKIDEKKYFQESQIYQIAATNRINLYRLFIACALDKIKKEGVHGFIVPMSLLGDRFTFELRRKILNESDLQQVEAFPQKDDPKDRVFFDAKLPTCVYILVWQSPRSAFKVRTHPGKDLKIGSPSYLASSPEIVKFDPINLTIPLCDNHEWDLARKFALSPILCPIGDIAAPMSGEVMFNEAFRPYLSENPENALVLRGGHVQRYELIDDPKQGTPIFINKERWLADSREGTSAFAHLKSRVVYQESAALDNWRRIIATYLPAGNICGHKICYFINVKYNELAFLAIFNSSVVEWRYGLVSTTNNLSAYQITAIPIPKFKFSTPAPERARLGAELEQLYAEGKHAEILAQVEACLPKDAAGNFIAERERSDVVHDLLAFLAEKMLEMNKQKQTEIKGFLGWLESFVGAKVEDLTPKTKLQSYYEHDYEGFLAVLKKNSKKLAVDPARREPAEALRAEFEGSMGKLTPLRERIRNTDELIDATVYRLYGLTEEEIGIVEGRESVTEHPRASSLDSA
jgi:type I restriction-modification system DNA methylase subunit